MRRHKTQIVKTCRTLFDYVYGNRKYDLGVRAVFAFWRDVLLQTTVGTPVQFPSDGDADLDEMLLRRIDRSTTI